MTQNAYGHGSGEQARATSDIGCRPGQADLWSRTEQLYHEVTYQSCTVGLDAKTEFGASVVGKGYGAQKGQIQSDSTYVTISDDETACNKNITSSSYPGKALTW